MLKVFRDNLKHLKWVLLVRDRCFVFFVWADFGSRRRQPGRRQLAVAAYVGDEPVSVAEFERQYRQLEDLYAPGLRRRSSRRSWRKQMRLPLQALDQAVNQKILLAEAQPHGPDASPTSELRDIILEEQVFKDEQGRFIGEERVPRDPPAHTSSATSSAVRGRVAAPGAAAAQAHERPAGQPLRQQTRRSSDAYRDQVERAKIRYVQLPRDRFVQGGADPPRPRSRPTSRRTKAKYRLPEQREVAYLLVDAAQLPARCRSTRGADPRTTTTSTRPSSPRRSRSAPATSW